MKTSLELTILRNLELRHPGAMVLGTLWAEVSLDESGATYTEFSRALGELEQKSHALTVRGEDRIKAKITDAGILRLAER
jgi:hypothetical protein